tara:strand:+ start:887 stop:2494 length:1608 start_codon:yes stop_codon:yes gene_type:complete
VSNLSELLPAGGGQNNTDFVADGAIASGKPVILNSAGTVSEVSQSTVSLAAGSRQAMYAPATGQGPGMFSRYIYHAASGYVVAIYKTTGDVIAAQTGIPQSDNTITWGTAVTNSDTYNLYAAAYDPVNEKVIMAQAGSTGRIGAITVTSSGVPSWSAWKENTENTNTGGHVMLCFVPTHNVMLLHYMKSDDNNKVRTIDCADDTPSNWVWGDIEAVSTSAGDYYGAMKWDTANSKALLIYHDTGTPRQCVISVGAASGDNITLSNNADATFAYSSGANHPTPDMAMCYDESRSKFVLVYKDSDADPNGNQPFVSVGTISGTSISWNTKVCWKSDSRTLSHHVEYFAGGYHADNTVGTVICTWLDDGAGGIEGTYPNMTTFVVNSSGNVSNYASTTQLDNGYYYDGIQSNDKEDHQMVCVDTAQKRFVAGFRRYKTTANSAITPRLIDTWVGNPDYKQTNLTATNLIGVASAAISDTATGTINTWGSRNEVQTSLTIASGYYVQIDGTITTTSTSPAQLIGQAITTTQINIKDYTG